MSSDRWQEPDHHPDPLPRRGLTLTSIFLGVVALGLGVGWLFNTDSPSVATVGSPAPPFDVENIVGGESIKLDELLEDGRPIVINLMASWCGPCRAEIPELSAFADANPDVLVLGVAVEDDYESFKVFVTEVRPTYPVAFDDGDMREAYPSLGLPATFFVNSDGTVGEVFNGILNSEILAERVARLD